MEVLNSTYTRLTLVLLPIILLLHSRVGVAENPENIQIKSEIITLIEDKVSDAYSFRESSAHQMPNFEYLDRVFPKWHHGDPALGRNFWLMAQYRYFLVFYRVDYVHVVNDALVNVRGKKLIIWTKDPKSQKLDKFWPIQFWSQLGVMDQRDNNYLHAMYAMRYGMKLVRDATGGWIISEAYVYDNPAMDNNLSDHCKYKKQLAELGLASDCEEKKFIVP